MVVLVNYFDEQKMGRQMAIPAGLSPGRCDQDEDGNLGAATAGMQGARTLERGAAWPCDRPCQQEGAAVSAHGELKPCPGCRLRAERGTFSFGVWRQKPLLPSESAVWFGRWLCPPAVGASARAPPPPRSPLIPAVPPRTVSPPHSRTRGLAACEARVSLCVLQAPAHGSVSFSTLQISRKQIFYIHTHIHTNIPNGALCTGGTRFYGGIDLDLKLGGLGSNPSPVRPQTSHYVPL